ncbi:hypothetical protein E5676_scaffold1452G00010 [Cucumis melo var. makuwa]|uniref:Uncharacterized protein n=1 Tax=Cucumis melo var. makuwa TaxID=1194695 RepID=A0A5D3BPI7_CUCMM|nr:hypothetical protein E5676_scaffold1452G00010 [Cucumis melo var. makuwa]
MKNQKKLCPPSLSIQGMEGQRHLVSPPVKNWGLTITSQYAFLSCLSSFMVRYSGVLGVEEPHQSIPNLVVKLYCSDDTVGEVLRKNSSTSG